MDTIEEWRVISAYPDYEVSESGRVRRAVSFKEWPAGRAIKYKINDGYRYVTLFKERAPKLLWVNRLVATAFIGEPPSTLHLALHWDGNRQNNHRLNLRWGTHSDNIEDMKRHGTGVYLTGENHHSTTLTDEIVVEARKMRADGLSYPKIAEHFQRSQMTIYDAIRGKTWCHIRP